MGYVTAHSAMIHFIILDHGMGALHLGLFFHVLTAQGNGIPIQSVGMGKDRSTLIVTIAVMT
jgi:hypothetical protein